MMRQEVVLILREFSSIFLGGRKSQSEVFCLVPRFPKVADGLRDARMGQLPFTHD